MRDRDFAVVPMNDYQSTDQLGSEIEQEIRRSVMPNRARMPNYVEHHPDADDVGRLTAEALVMTYEASAKIFSIVDQLMATALNLGVPSSVS